MATATQKRRLSNPLRRCLGGPHQQIDTCDATPYGVATAKSSIDLPKSRALRVVVRSITTLMGGIEIARRRPLWFKKGVSLRFGPDEDCERGGPHPVQKFIDKMSQPKVLRLYAAQLMNEG